MGSGPSTRMVAFKKPYYPADASTKAPSVHYNDVKNLLWLGELIGA